MTINQYSMNDFDTLTARERTLFADKAIEAAFQAWAHEMVTVHNQTLNLRKRFFDRVKALITAGELG